MEASFLGAADVLHYSRPPQEAASVHETVLQLSKVIYGLADSYAAVHGAADDAAIAAAMESVPPALEEATAVAERLVPLMVGICREG